mmetsp:Transcript_97001/g.192236  ORF Transcript_97001/g.192236 Transcript_97001/m.192236 type:complete len:80 (-) Transcript_97001:118-357(-)
MHQECPRDQAQHGQMSVRRNQHGHIRHRLQVLKGGNGMGEVQPHAAQQVQDEGMCAARSRVGKGASVIVSTGLFPSSEM